VAFVYVWKETPSTIRPAAETKWQERWGSNLISAMMSESKKRFIRGEIFQSIVGKKAEVAEVSDECMRGDKWK